MPRLQPAIRTPGGVTDDSVAIQAAIDSGKSTVYFPGGTYAVAKTVWIRGDITRVFGGMSFVKAIEPLVSTPEPMFCLKDGDGEVLVVEWLIGDYTAGPYTYIRNQKEKGLVLKHLQFNHARAYENTGSGDLFIENVHTTQGQWVFRHGQNIWARHFDPEHSRLLLE